MTIFLCSGSNDEQTVNIIVCKENRFLVNVKWITCKCSVWQNGWLVVHIILSLSGLWNYNDIKFFLQFLAVFAYSCGHLHCYCFLMNKPIEVLQNNLANSKRKSHKLVSITSINPFKPVLHYDGSDVWMWIRTQEDLKMNAVI